MCSSEHPWRDERAEACADCMGLVVPIVVAFDSVSHLILQRLRNDWGHDLRVDVALVFVLQLLAGLEGPEVGLLHWGLGQEC